jgi:hypothetical protein
MPTVSMDHAEEIVAGWRTSDADSPAGPLFVSGRYAEADIITATVGTGTGRCGTDCSGSGTAQCC